MRADAAAADRRRDVRDAARSWHEAGAIDDAALAAIVSAYPDDRHRLGRVFRILVAIFTVIAINGFFGLVALIISESSGVAATLIVFGAALCILTDVQIGSFRRIQGGTEAATALMGVVWLLSGVALALGSAHVATGAAVMTLLLAAVVLCAAAAWRWGYRLAAIGAALALFATLARLPLGRGSWIVVGLGLVPLLLARSDSPAHPPMHRRALRAVAVVALLAAYAGVHISSFDHSVIEMIASPERAPTSTGGPLRTLSIAATALLPLGIIVAGVFTRRTLLLQVGVLLALASAMTLRVYVHVAPLWVVLTASGISTIVTALLLRRWLHAGADHEHGGFTADPLFDPTAPGLLEIAGVVTSFSPDARTLPDPGGSFEGGGGGFGGGGASSTY